MTDELMTSVVDAYQQTIEQGMQGIAFAVILVAILIVLALLLIARNYSSADQRSDELTANILKLLSRNSDQNDRFARVVENNTTVVEEGLSGVKDSQVKLMDTIDGLQGALAAQTGKMSELVNDVRHWPKLINDTLQHQRDSFSELIDEIQANRGASSARFEHVEAALREIVAKLDVAIAQNAPVIQPDAPEVSDEQQN